MPDRPRRFFAPSTLGAYDDWPPSAADLDVSGSLSCVFVGETKAPQFDGLIVPLALRVTRYRHRVDARLSEFFL